MADTDALGRPLADLTEPTPEEHAAERQKRLRDTTRSRLRADADVLRRLMMSRTGRDWLYRLLESCHIYGLVADLGTRERNADPLVTYFRDGERNVGNRILQDAQRASAQLFQEMIREQLAETEMRQADEESANARTE